MAGWDNNVLYGDNVDFSGGDPVSGKVLLNGQLLIGSTASPKIRVGFISSPDSSILVTNGAGTIWLQAGGGIATTYISDAGSTTPISNQLTLSGSGSITTLVGPAGTITTELTGLTNHSVLIGAGTTTITKVGPVASTGAVLQSNGVGSDPGFSTATYPSIATGTGTLLRADGTNWVATTSTYPNTNSVSTLLYASSANVMSELTTANDGILVTSHTGVPSILAGPGATGKILQSNSILPPSYSTATYPSVATGTGKILYADGTNWVTSVPTFPASGSATTGKIIISDGTNWIASTPTYPAAAGANGNVLTSDGTNWTSAAASGGVTSITGTANQIAASSPTGAVTLSLVGPYTPSTYTTHGLLIGEGTSSITAMAAGSVGQIVQSGGASADPVWSTATYPATATGTSKILYADGTNFSASVPTFPVTASATTRKIIVSDGTNWTASTETWATPSTSGNVMTSDGTNWTSAIFPSGPQVPSQGLQYCKVTLTSAQIKALHATPITLVAAQGAGKVIVPVGNIFAKLVYGGTNVFVAGAGQTVGAFIGTASALYTAINNSALTASASNYCESAMGGLFNSTIATWENVAINAYNSSATEISGNAANNNTITISFLYYVVAI